MSHRICTALCLLMLLVGAAVPADSAQTMRPLALRDYYALVEVSSPAMSPDGTRVAFVRTTRVEEENRRHSEIWLAGADGSIRPRRLTSAAFEASSPVWNRDGTVLAFLSNRPLPDGRTDGTWFLDLEAGGEAYAIGGVEGRPVFSPDGLWIAFVKEAPASGEAARGFDSSGAPYAFVPDFERRVRERFDGRIFEWMGYRYDGRGYRNDPRDPAATPERAIWISPARGGTPRQLTRLGFDARDPSWSDDSRRLLFVADEGQRNEHTYERDDLWTVDLAGEVERLTEDEYVWSSPVWGRDDATIFARRRLGLDAVIESGAGHGAPVDVVRLDAQGGDLSTLTAGWDFVPQALRLAPDGSALFFQAIVAGQQHLFRMAVEDGAVTPVTSGRRWLSSVSSSDDGSRMAYVAQTASRPPEIYSAGADGGNEVLLSHANDVLAADTSLALARELTYASPDGTEIQGWLMLPPGYRAGDGPLPLVLAIHGGPHGAYGERFELAFQLWANAGIAVLYTNPRGSLGYGEDFLWATWGGGWGDADADDVLAGIEAASTRAEVDSSRLGVYGYSYGGFLTNMLVARTDRFAAAVSGAGISNWISDYGTADIPRTKESEFYGPPWQTRSAELLWEASPIRHAADVSTPTLFLHGEQDFRVPIEQAEQMYTALRKQEVPARFVRYASASHGRWTPADRAHYLLETLDWWQRWLEED